MRSYASVILAGNVYLLIPAVQRSLAVVRHVIVDLMSRLDRLAFTLAEKAVDEE